MPNYRYLMVGGGMTATPGLFRPESLKGGLPA
jgi:hypothetical protein